MLSSHIDHPFTCNYFLNPFNALSPPSQLSASLYSLTLLLVCQQPVYNKAPREMCVYVCLHIMTLMERLNTLYYIM